MRALIPALILLAVPLLTGCLGLGGEEDTGARDDLKSQANVDEKTGGIQGVVTDAAIQPVVGAKLTLMETSATATTASDGSFAFSNVLPGDYTMRIQAKEFLGKDNEITVSPGQVSTVDLILDRVPSTTPYLQQQEFTGFVECSVTTPVVGFAACGAVNLLAGGNVTNDRFLFNWDLMPDAWQVVTEINWEPNVPTGNSLSVVVEPDGLSNDDQTEYGDLDGTAPLVITTHRDKMVGADANMTAICDGEKEPADPVFSAPAEAYCRPSYIEEGGPMQVRIFVDGMEESPVNLGFSVQQEYHVIVTAFYHAPACQDYSVFNGNQCDQEETAREPPTSGEL